MENVVKNLLAHLPFKDATEIGDVVLMVQQGEGDGDLIMSYAQVAEFKRDLSKRDEWWQVGFVFLKIPPSLQAIILQPAHFTGKEIFTIGGRKVFIKALHIEGFLNQQELQQPSDAPKEPPAKRPALKLIK